MAAKLRQSIADFERAFHEESAVDRERRERIFREAQQRTLARHRERAHRRGSMRFGLLMAILLGTAVLVTIAMFQALYLVMG
jgi:hypothetical protein